MSVTIRVDDEVYETLLARKGEIESEEGRVVSFSEAIRDYLQLEEEVVDSGNKGKVIRLSQRHSRKPRSDS